METMKKLGLAALIALSSFYGCEKSDLKPDAGLKTEQTDVVAPRMMRISSFQWHNGERNDYFASYIFRFETNGSLMVIHEDEREYGRWNRTGDLMQIRFQKAPLNELNNNWTVLDQTRNYIKLGGLSPYDNAAEILQFESLELSDPH